MNTKAIVFMLVLTFLVSLIIVMASIGWYGTWPYYLVIGACLVVAGLVRLRQSKRDHTHRR